MVIEGNKLVSDAAARVADVLVHGEEPTWFRGTRGPWALWTSNSLKRITGYGGPDGGVLSAYVCRDGMADLRASSIDLAAMVEVPRMVEALYALGAEAQDIEIWQAGDVDAGRSLQDLLKIINEKVKPILHALHAGGAL